MYEIGVNENAKWFLKQRYLSQSSEASTCYVSRVSLIQLLIF